MKSFGGMVLQYIFMEHRSLKYLQGKRVMNKVRGYAYVDFNCTRSAVSSFDVAKVKRAVAVAVDK